MLTKITNPDWFKSFNEVNISIGTASAATLMTGFRQGCVHFEFNGVTVTVPDAIYAENLGNSLFSDRNILQNHPNWKYEVDKGGATFYNKNTGTILFTAKTAVMWQPILVLAVLCLTSIARGQVVPSRDTGTAAAQLVSRRDPVSVSATFGIADLLQVDLFRDFTTKRVQVQVQAAGALWASVGIGAGMDGSQMWVAWPDGKGSIALSQRLGAGHGLPTMSSANDGVLGAQPAGMQVAALNGATLLYGFSLPDTYFSSDSATQMIFAISVANGGPDTPEDPASNFPMHDPGYTWSQQMNLAALAQAPASPPASIPVKADTTTPQSGKLVNVPAPAPIEGQTSDSLLGAPSCNAAGAFCFKAVADTKTNLVSITLQTSATGWVAIGVGCKTMACGNMYIGWTNAGANIVSQRSSTGHETPATNGNTDAVALPKESALNTTMKAALVVSFQIPSSKISTTSDVNIIWASSDTAPSGDAKSTIAMHTSSGQMSVNFATGQSVTLADPNQTLKLAHGILMFIAWGILPFATVFIARYLKGKLGHWWYLLHLGMGLAILGLTAIAIILIEVAVQGPLSARFNSSLHAYMGAFVALGLLPLQIILGFVSNKLFNANRVSVPWWDQVHWWVGRLVIVLAWVEMFTGLLQYQSGIVIIALYVVGILMGVGVIVAGHYMFGGAVHHVKGAAGFSTKDAGDDVERKGTWESRSKFNGAAGVKGKAGFGTLDSRQADSYRATIVSDADESAYEAPKRRKDAARAGTRERRSSSLIIPERAAESVRIPRREETRRQDEEAFTAPKRGPSASRARSNAPPADRNKDRRGDGDRNSDEEPRRRGTNPRSDVGSPIRMEERNRPAKRDDRHDSPDDGYGRKGGEQRSPSVGRGGGARPNDGERNQGRGAGDATGQARRGDGGARREPSRSRDEGDDRVARRAETGQSKGPQRGNSEYGGGRDQRNDETRGPVARGASRRRQESPSPSPEPRRGGQGARSNSERRS
ncbi:hypothetical protein CcCBS67573_g09053 [Chytriomyces confervae]|uniref:Cytochrome b561 domain-containing protein n=1 Tax=Chytriomyces confervae TaxID=246404 RepID=A0A507E727_9FUNG|nr:hypothetical protein CcCBS67573_g09053 [Chytriomyces confervae]